MATITIRQLDERTKLQLRIQAASHGHSMEEEAREILRSALIKGRPTQHNLAESIRRRFASLRGAEIKLPGREEIRRPPDFTP